MSVKTEEDIKRVCQEVTDLLIFKNRSYGDSALHPSRIFSKTDNLVTNNSETLFGLSPWHRSKCCNPSDWERDE